MPLVVPLVVPEVVLPEVVPVVVVPEVVPEVVPVVVPVVEPYVVDPLVEPEVVVEPEVLPEVVLGSMVDEGVLLVVEQDDNATPAPNNTVRMRADQRAFCEVFISGWLWRLREYSTIQLCKKCK